ncbi:hypothetical protein KKH27_02020 [bacterium]|nr:hypothetical protein [bacterium]MBU1983151.1 hypothetical protein [bacterium]
MDTQGIATGSAIAQTVQKVANNPDTPPAKPAQNGGEPFLDQLARLGADHPLTKFLGGFYSQHVDTEA